jgi:hypothetical protein
MFLVGADQWVRIRELAASKTGLSEASNLRLASFILRSIFIVSLIVVILHVSMPQTESLWTVYYAPGDLVRLILGVAASAWIAIQLFAMPADLHAHRTWFNLGLIAVPFVLICIVAIW